MDTKETWTLKKTDQNRILAFEMYCYRRILHLNWTMKVTNHEVRKRLNIKWDIIQTLMGRKLSLFGHNIICRIDDSRKIKSVMLGIMDGKARRGRPNREWVDDIMDWCRQDLHSLTLLAQDRGGWKEVMKYALDTYGCSAHGS